MLTCITCSKQTMEDREEESPRGTPSTKEAVKSLTAQVLILHPPMPSIPESILHYPLHLANFVLFSSVFGFVSFEFFPFFFLITLVRENRQRLESSTMLFPIISVNGGSTVFCSCLFLWGPLSHVGQFGWFLVTCLE